MHTLLPRLDHKVLDQLKIAAPDQLGSDTRPAVRIKPPSIYFLYQFSCLSDHIASPVLLYFLKYQAPEIERIAQKEPALH